MPENNLMEYIIFSGCLKVSCKFKIVISNNITNKKYTTKIKILLNSKPLFTHNSFLKHMWIIIKIKIINFFISLFNILLFATFCPNFSKIRV